MGRIPTREDVFLLSVHNFSWSVLKVSKAQISLNARRVLQHKGCAAEAASVHAIELNNRIAFSENNIRRIRELLRECCQHHRMYSFERIEYLSKKHFEKYGNSSLPRRLIDVIVEDQSKIRLIEVKGRNEYLALSYCWRGSKPLVKTKDNLDRIRSGFELSSFTKTT